MIYDCGPSTHDDGTKESWMISLWQDHTICIASGDPIPHPLGSPAGPNQWFCGAPVVRARRPAYVVPFTDWAKTFDWKTGSFDTNAAVRWWVIPSKACRTRSRLLSLKYVITWKGAKISLTHLLKLSSLSISSRGTSTAVGSTAPYIFGMLWLVSSFPPHKTSAPSILAIAFVWSKIWSVVTVNTGPLVKFSSVRVAALDLILSSKPDFFQFSWMKHIDWAEHFCPIEAYASWSHCQAT